MGFIIPQVSVQRIIQEGLADLKANPTKLDNIFDLYLHDSMASDYGQEYIDQIKTWFAETRIPVVQAWSFNKRLLADERKVVGRFDARITGFDPRPTKEFSSFDPSASFYFPIYSSTFNDYVRRTLKYESVLPYEVLSDKVRPWKFGDDGGHGYLSVASTLRSSMAKNPHLKIMFVSGYFDLATPYFATNYTINRLDLSPQLQANITHNYYMGGHMMYHNTPSLKKLKADVAAFISSASGPRSPSA